MNADCTAFEPELSAWVDGELDPAARARLDAHLRSCDRCRSEVRDLRRVGDSLRRWDAHETRYAQSTGFRNRVLSSVGLAGAGAASAESAADVRVWRRAAWAAAAAAGVMAAAAWHLARPADPRDDELADARQRAIAAERRAVDDASRSAVVAAPGDAPAREIPRLGDLPPLVADESAAAGSAAASAADEDDPWEARGEDSILRDAVADYERFLGERLRLTLEERVARVEQQGRTSDATHASPPSAPTSALGRFLAQITISEAHAPAFERWIQVWPIESAATARGSRPIPLEVALDQSLVSVTEDDSGSVIAENVDLKGRPVLVLAGDVLRGGRRDRVARADTIIWPGSRISLPVWGAGAERVGTSYRRFTRSRLVAPFDVRALIAARYFDPLVDQRHVDQAVAASLVGNASNGGEGSLESLFTNPDLQGDVKRYVDWFRKRLDRPNVVGFVIAAGPHVLGAEICGDPETFRLLRDRLLRSHVLSARIRPSRVDGAAAQEPAVRAVLTAAAESVFAEPAATADGTVGIFHSVRGDVFGFGLLDGARVIHATVFVGTGSGGPAGTGPGGRGPLGKVPGGPGQGGGESPGGGSGRDPGSTQGGGIDTK